MAKNLVCWILISALFLGLSLSLYQRAQGQNVSSAPASTHPPKPPMKPMAAALAGVRIFLAILAIEVVIVAFKPKFVQSVQGAIERYHFRCFIWGLAVFALSFFIMALLSKAGHLGGLLAVIILIVLIVLTLLGLSGISSLVGTRTIERASKESFSQLSAVLVGLIVLALSIFIFPYACLVGLGGLLQAKLSQPAKIPETRG